MLTKKDDRHTPIVFSTQVPDNVFKAYSRWLISGGNGSNESKNSAWVKFCNECEIVGLTPITATKMINK